jgi:hypothetical protein
MISLTAHLLDVAPDLDSVFRAGVDDALAGRKPVEDYVVQASVRARHGFKETPRPMLSWDNHKLNGAKVKSCGLTLYHFRSELVAGEGIEWVPASGTYRPVHHRRITLNACPNAGHCVKVCVLNNGHGRRASVQRAWLWRTDFLARHPESFARVLAWELVQGVRKYGEILYRPDVNSNVEWQLILPSLCNGYLPGVMSYGYSKIPTVLDSDGWLGSQYRVAYSWNETSDPVATRAFLARGGSVAVVTSRRKGTATLTAFPFGDHASVDADKTDEWMFASGTVGDLSAKGKARQLIGKSRFVVGS